MGLKVYASALFLLISFSVYAQWSGVQGNEWINYNQTYLRVNISEKGLYKIPFSNLPAEFSKTPENLQIWHRGKEVAIIKVENNEVLFFGVPNDGSSDSLLFRPYSARLNPYQSFFSDQSSYFITSKIGAKRAAILDSYSLSGDTEPYHFQTDITTYRNQFSFSTLTASPLVFNNSFYENINSWTGQVIYGAQAVGATANNSIFNSFFSLTNFVTSSVDKPVLNMLFSGLHNGKHSIKATIGKTPDDKEAVQVGALDFVGLGGMPIGPLTINNIASDGKGVLSLKSTSNDIYDWFSLAYYTLTYPQSTKVINNKATYFNFKPTSNKFSRISIADAPQSVQVYDVTDVDNPKIVYGNTNNGIVEVMVPRSLNNKLTILASPAEEIKTITSDKIVKVDFTPSLSISSIGENADKSVNPSAYDYLIITSDTLKPAALEYGKYRGSVAGGGYNTLVMDIRNIYDQFNYGEPSAVAVKRFVNYMLKSGIRDNHNLLLVGISVTAPDSAQLRLKKELPHEVPTIGDPGADILLVSGIAGLAENVPAIPVGRISAFNPQQVLDYLAKVKSFESDDSDKGWQKNVLHLNGGKTAEEIIQLSTILRNLSPLVEDGELGGEVKAFVKPSTIETEKVDISAEVNGGVGMITYFGHGSPLITDLDMGKISDVSRNYTNSEKYCLMYFNGCGVGNVYSGRSVLPLSTDWLLSPDKGAIAVISNSYNSYVSPTSKHLQTLYDELFTKDISKKLTIGQIFKTVSSRILNSSPDVYDIANIHQSNLQGDPAVRLFNFSNPDYSFHTADVPVKILSDTKNNSIGSSSTLQLEVIVSNDGKYRKEDQIPLIIKYISNNGSIETKLENIKSVSFKDTLYFNFPYNKSINRVEVSIDPNNLLTEISKSNNTTELNIDWDVANSLFIYPDGNVLDVIAPILKVTLNDRLIENAEKIRINPTLKVSLTDNNFLNPDITLLDVYIKKCWDDACSFNKIDASANIKIVSKTAYNIELSYMPTDMDPGKYELFINGRDGSGNQTASPYKVQFEIVNDDTNAVVIVSPNPASSYVHFQTNIADDVESVQCKIYNAQGTVINTIDVKSIYPGDNDWYWTPNGATSGLYVYKIEFSKKDKSKVALTGKFVLL